MKLSKKLVVATVAAISTLGTLGLAGCGSSSSSTQEEKPTSIKVWYYEEDTSAMGIAWKKAMSEFTKKTGIKVNFEKKSFEQIRQNASQILNSDDAPDVMEYNKGNATAGLLASQGLLSNLNSYVSKYGWDKIITGSLAATGKYNDKGVMGSGDWYGITNYGEDVINYYNTDMFKKYNIKVPTNMKEFESALAAFKSHGITPLAEGVQEYPLQHLWYQLFLSKATDTEIDNYQMYKGDVNWSSPAMKYATQTIKDWVDKGYISKDSTGMKAEETGQAFENGTNPIFFSGTWWFGRFQNEVKKFAWSESKWPDTKKVVGSSGNVWVIPEKSTKKDAAAQFINVTMGKDIQTLLGNSGGVPINADTTKITDKKNAKLLSEFSDILKNDGLGFYPDWPTSTFYDDLNGALQELVNGTSSVDKTLQTLKSKYDSGVADAGVKE
ncbi:MAG: extracellular solute-binding protein [Bifidobacteriaceae bacterium]|jgi:raffinose/stachyose/melibiose transport system substrate-binding protein|nr:extracellular solute-binding protein [Bifidobacteriaceae bacterium]